MINVTSEELQRILATIEEALLMHDRWREELLRTLVCKLPLAASDIAEDAHQRCDFGGWFYSKGNSYLRNLPTFKKIGALHQVMHQSAREICLKIKGTGLVLEEDYDQCIGNVSQFREELVGLLRRVSYTLQNIDLLTGAFNHAKLLPDLRVAQQRLKENGAEFSLLLINFDLKDINKNHGRDTGDKVLRTAIFTIREALTPGDQIYRYGGAEFVICLPGKSMGDAELVKEQLLQKMGEALTETTAGAAITLHINYGVVELNPHAYLEELLDRSERATHMITL